MLPPPDPYSERPYQTRTVITTKGCCTRTEQETIVVMVPSNTMQRTQHQLRNRERVIHEHDVTMTEGESKTQNITPIIAGKAAGTTKVFIYNSDKESARTITIKIK